MEFHFVAQVSLYMSKNSLKTGVRLVLLDSVAVFDRLRMSCDWLLCPSIISLSLLVGNRPVAFSVLGTVL